MATQTYGPEAIQQVRGADPRYEYYEADQTAPAGQWRTRVNGDAWTLERAATAEFATVTTPISVASTGAITYSGTGTYTWTNTTDGASVQVAIFQGDRATPGDNDEAYISLRLSDSAGNQDEGARLTWRATTVLSGATQDTDLILSALVNNALTSFLTLDGSASTVVITQPTQIGVTSAQQPLLINGGGNSTTIPQVEVYNGAGATTRRFAIFASRQYSAITDRPNTIIASDTQLANNDILIGGGFGGQDAATRVLFYTAAGVGTQTGTLRVSIDSTGILAVDSGTMTLGVSGTTTGQMQIDGATSGTVTLTVAAVAGAWTMTLPAAVGTAGFQLTDAAGNGVTSWSGAASLREYKRDVETFGAPRDALDQILGTRVYRFNYREGGRGTGDYETRYVGVMADEAPWAMHHHGGIVNPINTLGYMVLGFQAVQSEVDELRAQVAALQAELAELRRAA